MLQFVTIKAVVINCRTTNDFHTDKTTSFTVSVWRKCTGTRKLRKNTLSFLTQMFMKT